MLTISIRRYFSLIWMAHNSISKLLLVKPVSIFRFFQSEKGLATGLLHWSWAFPVIVGEDRVDAS
jgi:hypothetical protein